ncbi:hypothetical protein CH380_08460 [Leptospira adleri]|uniref:Uncharacterized protein n=1 Tax=Leptospira adleri TaxID=2023186 RepID=A0A2M9YQ08_9LEPT|nr:hypothetical protein CH380_08460 [Leptospira adleri]PJZ60232.1 hypothetical protein CH376_19470 [Leptospira adleri]
MVGSPGTFLQNPTLKKAEFILQILFVRIPTSTDPFSGQKMMEFPHLFVLKANDRNRKIEGVPTNALSCTRVFKAEFRPTRPCVSGLEGA